MAVAAPAPVPVIPIPPPEAQGGTEGDTHHLAADVGLVRDVGAASHGDQIAADLRARADLHRAPDHRHVTLHLALDIGRTADHHRVTLHPAENVQAATEQDHVASHLIGLDGDAVADHDLRIAARSARPPGPSWTLRRHRGSGLGRGLFPEEGHQLVPIQAGETEDRLGHLAQQLPQLRFGAHVPVHQHLPAGDLDGGDPAHLLAWLEQ